MNPRITPPNIGGLNQIRGFWAVSADNTEILAVFLNFLPNQIVLKANLIGEKVYKKDNTIRKKS